MKVLVTGGNGQLGSALQKTCPASVSIITPGREELDLSKPESLKEKLSNFSFDAIVNAAAYTAVDDAEMEEHVADKVNALSVGEMAGFCSEKKKKYVTVSTDYVFDGMAGRPYTSSDERNPVNAYGRSKLKGEILALEKNPESIVVRTSWVYYEGFSNFCSAMLGLAEKKFKEVRVVGDQVGRPTYAQDLALFIWSLLLKPSGAGVLHFSNSGEPCSWAEFAREIYRQANAIGLISYEPVVSSISSEEYGAPAKRPKYGVLELDQWGRSPEWPVSLAEFLNQTRNAKQK